MSDVDDLMESTLKMIEDHWMATYSTSYISEDVRVALYTQLMNAIGERQLALVWQHGFDTAWLTTSHYAGANPYDADSTEHDYFAEGVEQGVGEIDELQAEDDQ